jgi:hypothetical protein
LFSLTIPNSYPQVSEFPEVAHHQGSTPEIIARRHAYVADGSLRITASELIQLGIHYLNRAG